MRFWVSPGSLGHRCLLACPPHGIPGIAVLLLSLLPFWAGAHCPCQDPALCQPITQHPDFEVFVFDVGSKAWKFYDWSQITTVVNFGKYDPELMCYAHSHGARVVLKGDVPLKDIINPSFRASWIAQKVKLAKTQYMDGINIDIEQEANCLSPEYYALTNLVKETTDSFHREIKGSQVTFDVSWSPKYKGRCYNYAGIADACDFLFVMSYDEQSQALSECTAAANAPYKETLTGYDDYIKIGINPKKLVMGVPWYGYDYTCLNLLEDRVCTIPKVPSWRDSCGITSGHQVPYKVIMKQVNSSVSGSHWDKDQQAPYYNYKDSSGHFHQVWYDDPQSISLKAAYIQKRGLRGIGMWHANCLDYSGDAVAKQQTEDMWKVLKPKL
ncbi:di-N-acetylchitobiase [Mustela nigripes]|uniref:di-N-acetylchitobiase n=1 Tax=Mustela nigripes TaxID=77151 RepID=UPI0028163F31|nr:di-N-acetylchitobiase [Mustela nigripes]